MFSKNSHAKAQRREEIQISKPRFFLTSLRLCVIFSLLLFSVASLKAETTNKPSATNVERLVAAMWAERSASTNAQVEPTNGLSAEELGQLSAAILADQNATRLATTNGLSEAEMKGHELAWQLCDASPESNYSQSGILQIRDANGKRIESKLNIVIMTARGKWEAQYDARTSNRVEFLWISHTRYLNNSYLFDSFSSTNPYPSGLILFNPPRQMSDAQVSVPFAHSDFWLCDLGLEFFRWPVQKVLPKTTNLKRGRAYTLLESTNPQPSTNGYSRVLSWIDQESGGILQAEAYDAQGKLLKVFEPKSFKKINGQWELQEMEIRNVQTGSRTRLEFDLKKSGE